MSRLYALALHLLPPSFRRAYGPALREAARAEWKGARGAWEHGVVASRLGWDLAQTMVREWWDVRPGTGSGSAMRMDLWWAARVVTRSPGYSLTVVLTLGLGIGTSTVALGLVDTYLLRALPFPDGDRLVAVWPQENWSREMVDMSRDRFPSLQGIAGMGGTLLVLQEGGEPEEVFASRATTNFQDVLGVRPARGRGFVTGDGEAGAEAVAILSHRVWADRFGSDPELVGRSIALGGEGQLRRTVIGVMPHDYVPLQGRSVDVWIPVTVDRARSEYSESFFMEAVGRLAPGASVDDAGRDLTAFAQHARETKPEWFTETRLRGATATPLAQARHADRRTPLFAALGAALLVLLVACANVANLVVARTIGRERELSVRAALGAGRSRNAQTVLIEVALLSGAGGAVGTAMTWALVRGLNQWVPDTLPPGGLALDARWIGAAVALAAMATVAAGLVPALHAARRDPARALGNARGASGTLRLNRIQRVLAAAQLAMATAGIAVMALLGRSLLELGRVDPGFEMGAGFAFRVTAPPSEYPNDEDVVRFFRDARRAVAEVPGVREVGFASRLPLARSTSQITVQPEGMVFQEGDPRPTAWHRLVTPGYLEALGVRLLDGRIPDATDDVDGAPELVVINRTAAERFWPGEQAIGKRFYGPGQVVWATVSGVVQDIRESGQSAPVLPALYLPHRDWPWRTLSGLVRTDADPLTLVSEVKRAVWSVSSGVPVSRVETLDRIVDRGLLLTRTLAALAGIAGGVTLLLGALGIYGVVSHAVARRLRELGVRAALGADRGRLLRGELAGATRIVVAGLGAGLLMSWLLGYGLRGVLYGVPALDLPSFAVATALLTSVAYMAAYLPARRASSVDPVRIIREE